MIKKEWMDQLYRLAFFGLILWYLGVCVIHYFGQRPLWNDEQAVFSSIQIFQPSEFFTQPLRMVQVFPHLYLYVIQAFSKCFDYSLLSLRFFSFIFMMGAFTIWLKIARVELKCRVEFLTFMLCWVASVPLIYYSAELKQYSLDVFVSGFFVLFLSAQPRLSQPSSVGKYGLTLAVLPAAVLFSYPAYFFLVFPLWHMCRAYKEDRSQLKFILLYLFSILVFAAISYQFDIRLRPVEAVTNGFNDYFISTHSWKDFFQTFGEGVNNLFSRWFVELPKVFRKLARFFMMFGFIWLFVAPFVFKGTSDRRFNSVAFIALIVFFELAVAGALEKYPFGVPRTALFLCPMLLILTIQGIGSLKKFNPFVYYSVRGAFIFYLLVTALGILKLVVTQPLIAIPTIWTS